MDMKPLSAPEIIKILADSNISIEIKNGQIGLPKKHNLPSDLMAAIKFHKTEVIRLLSSPQTNDTDSKPIEQNDENPLSINAEEVTPEFTENEFAQVVDVFRLLRIQDTKLRSAGLISSINYREVDVRNDATEEECSNSQVMESKPKTG